MSRPRLAQLYAENHDPIILGELHRLIMQDIDSAISAFDRTAGISEQSAKIDAIVSDIARLPRDSKEIAIAKLNDSKILTAKRARAKLSSLIPDPVDIAAILPDGVPKWVSTALRGSSNGTSQATASRLAGYLIGRRVASGVVHDILYAYAQRCEPPIANQDIDTIISRTISEPAIQEQPFQYLGYNAGSYFYLPIGSRQVVELRASSHRKNDLMALAPLQYWERAYPGENGPRWDHAINVMLRRSESTGVYDPARVRGRGAWWDDGRSVVHLGDVLMVDGSPVKPWDHPSKFIYEATSAMEISINNPLESDESREFLRLCESFAWDRPISGKLLAGWIMSASICGALSWRPHIWVTGPAGSGKSWILDNIIRRAIGGLALAVQSETTEAGIRQTLGNDARPIIFDEAEAESERAQFRMQNILTLMRQASSESGATIVKGSANGTAKIYRIRSCFALSSIGVNVHQHADTTRVSVLSLHVDQSIERFAQRIKTTTDLLTDEYINRLHARAITHIPTIRENAAVFAKVGAQIIGSQRQGDQIGALLAGAYALHTDSIITEESAREWVTAQDWTDHITNDEENDELRCLQRILEHVVQVRTRYYNGDRSIAELIRVANGMRSDSEIDQAYANDTLMRIGIRVEGDGQGDVFVVSNSHAGVARILEKTAWSRNWPRILRRVPGAEPVAPTRFSGVMSRGVAIPGSVVSL